MRHNQDKNIFGAFHRSITRSSYAFPWCQGFLAVNFSLIEVSCVQFLTLEKTLCSITTNHSMCSVARGWQSEMYILLINIEIVMNSSTMWPDITGNLELARYLVNITLYERIVQSLDDYSALSSWLDTFMIIFLWCWMLFIILTLLHNLKSWCFWMCFSSNNQW